VYISVVWIDHLSFYFSDVFAAFIDGLLK